MPDGNLERTIYDSSTDDDPPSFNNGFRDVSFRSAAYSVGFVDLSGSGGGEGEYRLRASDVETGRIFQYKGDPNNVKIFYANYWEWVPSLSTGMDASLAGIKSIMFQPVVHTQSDQIRPPALNASMISTTLDYYNIKNAFYAKLAYDTYDIGKVSPAVGKIGTLAGNLSITINLFDYYRYLKNGGDIANPRTALLFGDILVNRQGLKSPAGFVFTAGWELGKALGGC